MKQEKFFITGIAGFAGSYLAKFLLEKDFEVSGVDLKEAPIWRLNSFISSINLFQFDLLEQKKLFQCIDKTKPDYIFHLAALSHVGESWKKKREIVETNLLGCVSLLEVLSSLNFQGKIIIISSGECYGFVPEELQPIKENHPLSPRTPYSLSKYLQEKVAEYFYEVEGLNIIIVRPFNHIGPKQSPNFVTSEFAYKLALIESGKSEPVIKVGNLEAKRDFTNVIDVVNAYYLIALYGKSGEVYNVASGKAISIRDILDLYLSFSRLKIEVIVDKNKFRPVDIPVLSGDFSKLNELTGWYPQISIEESLQEILNYWRDNLNAK